MTPFDEIVSDEEVPQFKNVYVDVPPHKYPDDTDAEWKNVANFNTVPAAVAWIREHIGNCDDNGNICLITLGERCDEKDVKPKPRSAAEQRLDQLTEKLKGQGYEIMGGQVLSHLLDRAEICVRGVQLDPSDVAKFCDWGLRLLVPITIRQQNCWQLQFEGPSLLDESKHRQGVDA